MIRKIVLVILWAPGFIVALPLRIIYQGFVIGMKVADELVEDGE